MVFVLVQLVFYLSWLIGPASLACLNEKPIHVDVLRCSRFTTWIYKSVNTFHQIESFQGNKVVLFPDII